MLFNSLGYLYLVIIAMLVYYARPFRKAQVFVLIASSFYFYAYNTPLLLALLVFSTLLFAFFSYTARHNFKINRSVFLIAGVTTALGILTLFKYGPLLAKTFIFPLTGDKNGIASFIMAVPLPIGISFFTFEGISLIVDSFRNRDSREKAFEAIEPGFANHLRNTAFFISFFPHLIAGPIIKAHQFFPQIGEKYFKNINWGYAFRTLILGYFLKMVVADNLKDQTFWIAYPYFTSHSSFSLLSMLYGYSIQIFADFAGYSLIALGTASLFGYTLPVNFNFPYIARSFSDFWQRWHISLSTWLKTYLYIPIGGNKKGVLRTYFNIMTVMFVGGLWHGAAWSYAVWGIWHGLMLILERFFGGNNSSSQRGTLSSVLRVSFVFSAVTVSWLFFKLPEFGHVLLYFKNIATNFNYQSNPGIIINIFLYSLPVVFYHAWYLLKSQPAIANFYRRFEFIPYGIMLFFILTNSGSSDEFIYFQF